MNEPTGGDKYRPTAPVPPARPGLAYAYGQQPAAPHEPAPPAPPLSNPYAQQPPAHQFGQPQVQQYGQPPVQQYGQPPAPQYGQPPAPQYGQPPAPQYGQPPVQQYGQPQAPAYGQPYGTGAQTNVSAIILTILSVLSICNLVAIGSLVLGIVALTKNATDPEGSRRMTNIGWIVLGVSWALGVLYFLLSFVSQL